MKTNKGIIGIGLVLAIVLGIVVVGGGAYYVGKSTDKWNTGVIIDGNTLSNSSDGDIGNKEQVPSRGSAVCEKDTTPWIILVSPNGGESYVLNQKVDVKWKSCNIPAGVDIGIDILNELKSNPLTVADNVAIQQTPNDGIETIYLTEQKDMQKFILGNKFKIRLNYVFTEKYTGPMPEGRQPQWAVYNDDSDNYFTINSATSTSNLKTYTNKEYGIEFDYPSTANITEKQLGRTDLTQGSVITVSLPFKTHYDAWTSKGINFTIRKSSCSDYLPTSPTQKRVINGTSYMFVDPDWGETSGMSSISKWRKYFYEPTDKCYIIEERLSGLGNNERPSTYTFPTDVDKFLDSELLDLDKIMASVKIF